MFDNNFQLISISILIISCIYLFYVNFVNIRDLNNISRELNEIKISHTILLNQLKSLKGDIELKCNSDSKDSEVSNQPTYPINTSHPNINEFKNDSLNNDHENNQGDNNGDNIKNNDDNDNDNELDSFQLDELEELNNLDLHLSENNQKGINHDEFSPLKRMNGIDENVLNTDSIADNESNINQEDDKQKNTGVQNTLDMFFSNSNKNGNINDGDYDGDYEGDGGSNNLEEIETQQLSEDNDELDLNIDLERMEVVVESNENSAPLENSNNNEEDLDMELDMNLDMDLDLNVNLNELHENNENARSFENNEVQSQDYDKSKINESTVKELKVMCKNLNLSTRGNKTELINRINLHLSK